MSAEEIYSNSKAAREAAVDLRTLFMSTDFQLVEESFYGHDAFFRAKKKESVVVVEWLWGGGLTIRFQGGANEEIRTEVLGILAAHRVREEQVI